MSKIDLKTKAGIIKEIDSIGTASKRIMIRIQNCAVACIYHASSEKMYKDMGANGDPSLINRLIKVVPDHFRATLQTWAVEVGHVRMDTVEKEDPKTGRTVKVNELVYDKEKAKKPLPVAKDSNGDPIKGKNGETVLLLEHKMFTEGRRPQEYNGFDAIRALRLQVNKLKDHTDPEKLKSHPEWKEKDTIPAGLAEAMADLLVKFAPEAREEKPEVITGEEADKVREKRTPSAQAA